MKMKNKIILISFIALLFSCKKGEKDPFISLISRKSRLSNEWKIDSWKENQINSGFNTSNQSIDLKISRNLDQNTFVVESDITFLAPFFIGTASVIEAKWKINKKGEWEKTLIYEYSTQNYTNVTTERTKGFWNFIGKGNEFKNKERVVFHITSKSKKEIFNNTDGTTLTNESIEEFNNGDNSVVYEIVQLKSKEVIIKRNSLYDNLTQASHSIIEINEEYILKK